MSQSVWFNWDMSQDATKIVAENLRAIIEASRLSSRAWALQHSLEPKQVQRVVKASHALTLDTLNTLAKAADLMPWQLLVPNLDPKNPPVVTMTEAERALYRTIRNEFAKLKDINGN